MESQVLENLGKVVFTLRVPLQRLELGLQEVGGEGMAADSLEQGLDVRPPVLPVVAHPSHACLEDFRLTTHIELITADEGDQLAVRQVEELLLGRHLDTGEERNIHKLLMIRCMIISFEYRERIQINVSSVSISH